MKPFSESTLNLQYLIKTGKMKRMNLREYVSSEVVAKLKHSYLDDSYVHHVIHQNTVGYFNGKLVFVYLKDVVPVEETVQAEYGLAKMKFYNTKGSRRGALKKSGGHELQFGWIDDKRQGIRQFAPTLKQKEAYKLTWPLLDRMDGIFARVLPNIWRGQLLNQAGKKFKRTATRVSSFSTITMLKNAPTSIHLDSKNAEAGLTVLTTAGQYTHGEFFLVQFGISLPIQPGAVLIAATHQHWHCNLNKPVGLRYSVIGYFREGLK
jgi:hypothetical protein